MTRYSVFDSLIPFVGINNLAVEFSVQFTLFLADFSSKISTMECKFCLKNYWEELQLNNIFFKTNRNIEIFFQDKELFASSGI